MGWWGLPSRLPLAAQANKMALQIDTSRQSPNSSSRNGAPISILVLHATVGSLASSLSWLCSPASRVSSHYVISKTGLVFSLVPDARAAWHAGKSAWKGMGSLGIETHSIGIELENMTGAGGFKGQDPYPLPQVHALTALTQTLIGRYHIRPEYIVRHLDIAIPEGRKTDPAGFPWEQWKASIGAPLASLYQVVADKGVNVRAGPSPTTTKLGALEKDALFHGVVVEGTDVQGISQWIKRLTDEGGGYCWAGAVKEVK